LAYPPLPAAGTYARNRLAAPLVTRQIGQPEAEPTLLIAYELIDDPGQQLGVAGGVVADRGGGDRGAVGQGDLHLVGVAVGVDTDHGVEEFCQHGHRPGSFREGAGRTVGTGLGRGHRVAHL